MYASNAAASAYATVTTNILGPRDIEQRVFQQTNGQLMAVRDDPGAHFSEIAEAVHVNTQLWTMLAVDVFSDENTLPLTLRSQIASLALFSQKTGRAVLRGEAKIDDLIEVNRAMIGGLEGMPAPIAKGVQ